MRRETFSDGWVKRTFRSMIEGATDFPEIDGISNEVDWYLERATLPDMRIMLSHIILNERVKIREYVSRYLMQEDEK